MTPRCDQLGVRDGKVIDVFERGGRIGLALRVLGQRRQGRNRPQWIALGLDHWVALLWCVLLRRAAIVASVLSLPCEGP